MCRIYILIIFFSSAGLTAQKSEFQLLISKLESHESFSELDSMSDNLMKYNFDYRVIPSIFPLDESSKFRISSLFGRRNHPIEKKAKMHQGIDIASDMGSYVYSTADGIIELGSMPKIGQNVPFNYSSLIFTSFNFSRSNEDLPLCARKSYSPSILICCQVIIELLFIEFNNLSYSFSSFNTDNFCDIVR